MNHSLRIQLEWYMRHGTQGLTPTQLQDYLWHLDQLVQEIRQEILTRQQPRPLGPLTRS